MKNLLVVAELIPRLSEKRTGSAKAYNEVKSVYFPESPYRARSV